MGPGTNAVNGGDVPENAVDAVVGGCEQSNADTFGPSRCVAVHKLSSSVKLLSDCNAAVSNGDELFMVSKYDSDTMRGTDRCCCPAIDAGEFSCHLCAVLPAEDGGSLSVLSGSRKRSGTTEATDDVDCTLYRGRLSSDVFALLDDDGLA